MTNTQIRRTASDFRFLCSKFGFFESEKIEKKIIEIPISGFQMSFLKEQNIFKYKKKFNEKIEYVRFVCLSRKISMLVKVKQDLNNLNIVETYRIIKYQ